MAAFRSTSVRCADTLGDDKVAWCAAGLRQSHGPSHIPKLPPLPHNRTPSSTFLGLNATEPCAQGEKGPSFAGSDLSTQWLLSGNAVSPPSIGSARHTT